MLALLAVAARPRGSRGSGGRGGPPGDCAGVVSGVALDLSPIPNEKVLAEFLRNPGLADCGGGTGMSLYCACTLRSDLASIDEGFVDTLKRDEDAALS